MKKLLPYQYLIISTISIICVGLFYTGSPELYKIMKVLCICSFAYLAITVFKIDKMQSLYGQILGCIYTYGIYFYLTSFKSRYTRAFWIYCNIMTIILLLFGLYLIGMSKNERKND